MRLGTESVGRWGLVILVVTGVLGAILAIHGWSTRSSALARVSLGNTRSAAPASSPSSAQPSHQGPTPPSSNPSADHNRPLLSEQPYASVAYQVWPGTPSAAAETALIGLSVRVKQQGSALVVSAGVVGQTPTQRTYAGGARVYVVEQSLGDDSGNTDYNLGDDALVVTDAKGGIIQ